MAERGVNLLEAEHQTKDLMRSRKGRLGMSFLMENVGAVAIVSFSAGISSF